MAPADLSAQGYYNWNLTWQAAHPNYDYVAIKQQRWRPGLPNPPEAGYLGRNQFPNDPYFHGKIDHAVITDHALSAAQIAALAVDNQAPQVIVRSIDGGDATQGETWSQLDAGDTYAVRIVNPSRISTAGFVVHSEELTVFDDTLVRLPWHPGSGRWIQFKLITPVRLLPDKTYGFDVGCGENGAAEV